MYRYNKLSLVATWSFLLATVLNKVNAQICGITYWGEREFSLEINGPTANLTNMFYNELLPQLARSEVGGSGQYCPENACNTKTSSVISIYSQCHDLLFTDGFTVSSCAINAKNKMDNSVEPKNILNILFSQSCSDIPFGFTSFTYAFVVMAALVVCGTKWLCHSTRHKDNSEENRLLPESGAASKC